MKKLLLICALTTALPLTASMAHAQTTPTTSSTGDAAAPRPKQEQLVGAVVSIDAATGQVTIKTDAGKTISLTTGAETAYLRIAPGARTLDNAAKITRAEVAVGDRVLVRANGTPVEGQPVSVRQLIVMSRDALAGRQADDWRRRGINGRITAINPDTKEITITARSRDAMEMITINASGNVRLLRYAPDSLRREDAQPAAFAALRVGDQLRALGDRSADGTHFTPEEVIAGSFARVSGTITGVDAAKGEVKVKDDQTGKTLTVSFGGKSTLRRIPPDFVEMMAKRREEMQQRRAQQQAETPEQAAERQRRREERQRERAAGGGNTNQGERGQGQGQGQRRGGGPGGGGFGGLQQILESMPTVTVSDLKKGDGVLITGTPMQDATKVTAITLVTGDAAVVKTLQQFQGPGGQRSMNPGLPGDVVGGGTGEQRERP